MSDFERSESNGPEELEDDETALKLAQEKAVAALLSAPTLECAAKSADISPATLRRWRKEPAFTAAVRASRLAVMDGVTMSLRNAAQEAAQTLREALSCERPADRIRAAQIILETAFRSAELDEMTTRLEDLEEHLAAMEERREADAREKGTGQ